MSSNSEDYYKGIPFHSKFMHIMLHAAINLQSRGHPSNYQNMSKEVLYRVTYFMIRSKFQFLKPLRAVVLVLCLSLMWLSGERPILTDVGGWVGRRLQYTSIYVHVGFHLATAICRGTSQIYILRYFKGLAKQR